MAFSTRLSSWPRQHLDSSFRTSLTFSGIVGGNVHAMDLHVRWVTRTANHFTFTRETTQLSFRGKQALVVGALEAPPALTCDIVHSLPLRRLLEESTGLLEEEGGSQRCSARK